MSDQPQLTDDQRETLEAAIERQKYLETRMDDDYEFDDDDETVEMFQDAYDMQNLCIAQADIITEQTAEIARLRAEATIKDQTIQLIQDHNEELKRVNKALATGKGNGKL